MYLNAFGLTNLFDLFSCTLYVGDHIGDVPIVVVVCRDAGAVDLLVCWLLLWNLCCSWCSAQLGNWHAWRALLMFNSSWCSASWLDETTLALCAKVLYTLCFAVMKWLLSLCSYWSV